MCGFARQCTHGAVLPHLLSLSLLWGSLPWAQLAAPSLLPFPPVLQWALPDNLPRDRESALWSPAFALGDTLWCVGRFLIAFADQLRWLPCTTMKCGPCTSHVLWTGLCCACRRLVVLSSPACLRLALQPDRPLSQAARLRVGAVSLASVDGDGRLRSSVPGPPFCLPPFFGTAAAPPIHVAWFPLEPGAMLMDRNGPGASSQGQLSVSHGWGSFGAGSVEDLQYAVCWRH